LVQQQSRFFVKGSIMWQRWFARGQRRGKRARALRASPHLEPLEQRDLLTNSLVVVPSPAVTGGALYGTAALAPDDIWAVGTINTPGSRSQPLAEHFDGNSWQVVQAPAAGSSSWLNSVAAVSSNDVWAVGGHFVPGGDFHAYSLIEHWDGNSWTIIDSPTSTVPSTGLFGVAAISSNDVWAVGDTVEHWDGSSWSVVSSSAFSGSPGLLLSVSADAGNDVWAVSRVYGPGIVHFDGTSWARIEPHSLVDFSSITALSPTDVWAVGSFLADYNDIRPEIEHWDGSQWRIVPSPDPRPGGQGISELSGVAAISPTDIWAVGTVGAFGDTQTLTEHWDGTRWSIIPSPSPGNNSELIGVTARSDGTVAAVGAQGATQPLILQNPESAPPPAPAPAPAPAPEARNMDEGQTTMAHHSGPALPAGPWLVGASADRRWSLAGPGAVSNGAMLDTPLMPDPLSGRSVDPLFASGKPDPALRSARDRSLAPQGPEGPMGQMDALDRLFTEWT
jgi:hypothetical protein